MLTRKNLQLVVPVNDLSLSIDDKGTIKEALRKFRMRNLCLRNDECIKSVGELAQVFGLLTGNIDRQLVYIIDMILIEDLVGKVL